MAVRLMAVALAVGGRAFMFRGWVCGQRQTGGRYSPTLNVCADGTRSVRFPFAG
jgi:hypothetical protein